MLTTAPATYDIWEFLACEMTTAADNRILRRHVEHAEFLEYPYQKEAYFDVIMRVRRHRPLRRWPIRTNVTS